MEYEINGRPLEELILESARESKFDKKTIARLEDLCLPKLKEQKKITIELDENANRKSTQSDNL